MQEPVCIVLNEREGEKAKIAEALQKRLRDFDITASRTKINNNLIQTLLHRSPAILILDYVLGDIGTGIDVITAFQSRPESERPSFYFLTDEPSIQAAVEAMRLGAKDYIELNNADAINVVARHVYREQKERALRLKQSKPCVPPRLDQLVANSQISQSLVRQAIVLAKRYCPIIALEGLPGSGRKSLAHGIHLERGSLTPIHEIDLGIFQGKLRLDGNASFILTNVEEDDGSLLQEVAGLQKRLWPKGDCKNEGFALYVCSRESGVTNAWLKLAGAEKIRVPSLNQRSEDIPALCQRFHKEAGEISDLKIKPLSTDILSWLGGLQWPGEIQQLKSIMVSALIETAEDPTKLQATIEQKREVWSEEHDLPLQTDAIDPFVVLSVLERFNQNFRLAAAYLGVSILALKRSLA